MGDKKSTDNLVNGKNATHLFKYDPANSKDGTTTYIVKMIVNYLKCPDTIKIHVEIKIAGNIDTIYNIVSHINEFGVRGKSLLSFNLVILNRWGVKVFDDGNLQPSNITSEGNEKIYPLWAGKNKNGNKLPAGTYFYVLKATTAENKILPARKGYVTILN